MLSNFLHHSRFAARAMLRERTFALSVVVTLALAIGASTAVFSFVNTLLLRPFPFRDASRLVEIQSMKGGEPGKVSMAEVEDMRRDIPSLESIAAHTGSAGGYNYSGEGRPEEWKAILATGNLFEVLGTPLALGGAWPTDMDRNRGYRVILSHAVWLGNFGGRQDIVGKKITLDHAPGYEIHGVAPPGFDFPRGVQVFRSLGGFASYDKRDSRNVVAVARLRPGVPEAEFLSELNSFGRRMAERFPEQNRGLTFRSASFTEIYSGKSRPYLLVLLGAVALVLFMACLNAANLMLARALGRQQDLTVRLALGASHGTVAMQFLAESLVLSVAAAALGLLLARWWMSALRAVVADRLPAWMSIDLDWRVLLFSVGAAALASLLSAIPPALGAISQSNLANRIREGGRSLAGSRSAAILRDALIASQVAVAVILLAGAGLLIRGFIDLQNQDKGFQTASISTFRVALGWKRYINQDLVSRYYERAQADLARIPGVTAVAFGHAPPLSGQETSQNNVVAAEGQSAETAQGNPFVALQPISENYFETLRIPLRSGRAFTTFDRVDSAKVAIVSRRLAERLWPGQDAIGKRLVINPNAQSSPFREVVGVASDVREDQLGGPDSLDVYLPYRQISESNHYILVKTTLPLKDFRNMAERTLWAIDPQQSIFDFKTYDDRILESVWQLRLSQSLLLVFGGVALALAAIGIYGLMSYVVAMQRRELGVRLALGAQPSLLRWLILQRGGRLAGFGVLIGLGGSFVFGLALARQLPQLQSFDLLSLGASVALVMIASLLATAIPAWRASKLDPLIALRGD